MTIQVMEVLYWLPQAATTPILKSPQALNCPPGNLDVLPLDPASGQPVTGEIEAQAERALAHARRPSGRGSRA